MYSTNVHIWIYLNAGKKLKDEYLVHHENNSLHFSKSYSSTVYFLVLKQSSVSAAYHYFLTKNRNEFTENYS